MQIDKASGRLPQSDCNLHPVRGMKVSEVMRMLHDDGWYLATTRDAHRQYKHPAKPGRVTVAGKPSDDLAPGTLRSILKQAGFKK